MQVWNVLNAARWKIQDAKKPPKSPSGHHRTTLSGYIFATKARIDTIGKNLLSSNTSSTCPHNMANFGPLTAEIGWPVRGTPANFNWFRVLGALLHGIYGLVVGVSQTLWRWTEGATYIRHGDHHVGHWPTFLVIVMFSFHFILLSNVMLLPVCRLSVCCLSVTLVHPTQAVEIFGNICMAHGTLAIRWQPQKMWQRSSQGNPSTGGVKHKRGSQI